MNTEPRLGEVQTMVPSENFPRYRMCSAVIRRTARTGTATAGYES